MLGMYPNFDPLAVAKPSVSWVQWDGSPIDIAQGMAVENLHISSQFCKAVADGEALGNVSMLSFRDPDAFIAGNLHVCRPVWEHIAEVHPCYLSPTVLKWIKNYVDVHDFFQPFKGDFKGESFDSALPPPPKNSKFSFLLTVCTIYIRYPFE